MWQQSYTPIGDSLALSALFAAIPIFTLLLLLGVLRKPAWMASLAGLAAAVIVAAGVYGMPLGLLASTITFGAAFGLFPIGWVVFSAILLYRVTLESGKFEVLKESIGHLTNDPRLQALLIAFAFGAFIEGAAGFGTPVAVAAAMLTGLGFEPFYAAAICLLANTAPVAFGSIAIPITTLAVTTGLPLDRLSAGVGRICAPVSLFVPAYLILVMSGWKGLRGVLPAAAMCGVAFAGTQFLVSNFMGPQLTDILASMAAMGAMLIVIWRRGGPPRKHSGREIRLAWTPYLLLVIFVLLWGYKPLQAELNKFNILINWPGLHNLVVRDAAGGRQARALSGGVQLHLALRLRHRLPDCGDSVGHGRGTFPRPVRHGSTPHREATGAGRTHSRRRARSRLPDELFGSHRTLGLAFAATGVLFPFFSALLGWLGVFLTGSDTSANALFGTLQVVTAQKLGQNPVLMAAANSAGGVMGKMISLTSIAVAAAATSMKREDEARLFRFTLRHSIFLASMIGLLVMFYAYVMPGWAP